MKLTALIAQDPAPPPAEEGAKPAGPSSLMTFAPFILLGIFFLVVMLPAKRRQAKEQATLMASMKPGSKVITNSGIVARIITIKDGDDEVVIKSDDTKLRVLRSSISRVISDETPAETKTN